jgi:hypothetical protein
MRIITRTLATITLGLAALALGHASPVAADDGCEVVDYQGAPATICPPPIPDPTNCYTGWYQGAPIEVCLPTGETLPEGTTMADGSPVVYHVSADYVPPAAVAEAASAPAIDLDLVADPQGNLVVAPVTIGHYFTKTNDER